MVRCLAFELIYITQLSLNNLAQAILIGENFIGTDSACLLLEKNIFVARTLFDYYTPEAICLNSSIIRKLRNVILFSLYI